MISFMSDCVNSYSAPTGDFEQAFSAGKKDIGEIEICNLLYTHAHIVFNILGDSDEDINDNFRNIHPDIGIKVIRCELIQDFVDKFDVNWTEYRIEDKLCLNIFHNLQEELFSRIGAYINQSGMTKKQAYEAGFAYLVLMHNFDLKGTKFLIDTVLNYITPLFNSFFASIIYSNSNPEIFQKDHFFTITYTYFLDSADPMIKRVMKEHYDRVFFDSQDLNVNDQWLFNSKDDVNLTTKLLWEGCQITQTMPCKLSEDSIDMVNVNFPEIKKMSLTIDDFRWEVEKRIFKKYGIRSPRYEEKDCWTNNGDFMQFCAIFFYEICTHALVVKEFINE